MNMHSEYTAFAPSDAAAESTIRRCRSFARPPSVVVSNGRSLRRETYPRRRVKEKVMSNVKWQMSNGQCECADVRYRCTSSHLTFDICHLTFDMPFIGDSAPQAMHPPARTRLAR